MSATWSCDVDSCHAAETKAGSRTAWQACAAAVSWQGPGDTLCAQVIAITVMISLFTWTFVTLAVVALAPFVPVLAAMSKAHMRMLASLAGTLMIARSPATAVRLNACWTT